MNVFSFWKGCLALLYLLVWVVWNQQGAVLFGRKWLYNSLSLSVIMYSGQSHVWIQQMEVAPLPFN